MACEGLFTVGLLNDCENPMIAGIEVDLLFFNTRDIDKTASVFSSTEKTLMTNFQLKPSKTGLLIQGVKQINSLKSELVKKERTADRFKHTFSGVMLNLSTANKDRLLEMASGANLAVMVQLKFKGNLSKDAFQLSGFDSGLELATANWASNENDGTLSFELISVDGYEETKPLITVLETDYATTATLFANKFVQAPI
jgi:hypothetical protein